MNQLSSLQCAPHALYMFRGDRQDPIKRQWSGAVGELV